MPLWKILLFTTIALLAFAANSVLCRLALGQDAVDALGFTVIRLVSGAVVLILLVKMNSGEYYRIKTGSWKAAAMLFFYAVSFSYAYISLDAATGALILFASVQFTMVVRSIWVGDQLNLLEWVGLSLALFGFVYLVMPELHTPSIKGFALMTMSGVAWGIYTTLGRGSRAPLVDTATNFVCTWPFVMLLLLVGLLSQHVYVSTEGLILAVASGALASGVGYAIWYKALPGLSSTQAAVVQLLVPVLAAIGGVVFIEESLSIRLVQAGAMMLGGIALVFVAHRRVLSADTK